MNLLLHFKVNEGDDNNINIQEYKLYGDVEKKYDKCLVDEGNEVVLTEFPVPEFKNCTLMKKGDEGFYEYKDYRQGENAELAGGYAVSGILQQNKRFDFNYVNDQINGIVQDPFYKVETMGDYQIPMRVLDAYNDLYMAALATTEYIYYLHDSDDVLMVGLENRQTIARGEFAMDSYQESFENIYYGNSYEEEIWLCKDEWEHDLYSSNEYSLTDAGKTKVKHFIEDCRIKQDSILKAGLDTAKETTLPSVEDILCNVEDMVDEDGKYTNAWNITDNYLSDPLELNKDDDFVIHSNEQVKDVLIPLPLVVKETPLPPSYEVSTSQPHYTEVNLFDVSDDVCHEEDTNDFSPWSDRSINNILRIGSGFVNGKYRIYHLYTAMNVNAKDKATYLKNEYGIGGRTYDFKNKKQDKGYIDHDSKGLTICVSSKDSASLFKDSESKTFSWADVSSRIERLIATGKYFTDEEMEHYNSMNKDEILPAWLLEKCGLSDYTKNSQAVARPDWMEEYEILIDRDNDYVLLRDPDENVNQVWTASGKFLSTVQLENETVAEAMEEYYYNITKGGFYIPDRIKEGYMEEDYDNLSKEDIEL